MMALVCLPMMSLAQSNWEVPTDEAQQTKMEKQQKQKTNKPLKTDDPKYLTGAVPEIDGKVVFTLDKDVPGLSAGQIYEKTYTALEALTKDENQTEGISKIALVNKGEHIIAARCREWLVFADKALVLDRTLFNYTLIAHATDGHLNVTMERLNYQYETDRHDAAGLSVSAEEWITDKEGLNKAGTRLARKSGKFRKKTIDRKDEVFTALCKAVDIDY